MNCLFGKFVFSGQITWHEFTTFITSVFACPKLVDLLLDQVSKYGYVYSRDKVSNVHKLSSLWTTGLFTALNAFISEALWVC